MDSWAWYIVAQHGGVLLVKAAGKPDSFAAVVILLFSPIMSALCVFAKPALSQKEDF